MSHGKVMIQAHRFSLLMSRIIGLDIATKTGIAILEDNNVRVYYIEGSPVYQWEIIKSEITPDSIIVIEDFSYFNARNPFTTAILNQRLGYLYWRIVEEQIPVSKYNVNTVRKFLGITNKKAGEQKKEVRKALCAVTQLKLTSDESDALALLLYHIRITINISQSSIYNFTKTKRCLET